MHKMRGKLEFFSERKQALRSNSRPLEKYRLAAQRGNGGNADHLKNGPLQEHPEWDETSKGAFS